MHLDLKPTNILLDDNLVPKLADFGLSRCFVESQNWASTSIRGTAGYIAPEYYNYTEVTHQLSPLLDIYSLGIIIIEILTGRKGNIDADEVVESWSNMVEKSHSDVQMEQVRICAEIAIECIDFNPAKRPDTQHIISRLDQIKIMDGYVKTGMITSHQAKDAPNELHQDTTDAPGETSFKVLKIGVGAISKRNLKKRKIRAAMENNPHHSAWLEGTREMEEDPVTVSLGPSGPLFQKLRSVIASQDSRLKRVKVEILFLGQGLKGLCNGFSKDLFEAPQDSITRCWMRQVRDLCYDTTDYLDQVMHFIQYSGTGRGKIRIFWGKRLGSKIFRVSRRLTWVSLPKVKRLKRGLMIAKLLALLARVEDADERRERFKISPPEASKHDYSQAARAGISHPMARLPIQLHVDKLIKLLAFEHDDNLIEKELKVVSIFGSASSDKTAVAKTLYHRYGGKFQYRAFLRVSRDPDMRRLLTDMLTQFKAPPTHTVSDVQGLIESITKHLQGKRYLIIIDDLWSTSAWDIIIRALPDGDYCRIITTTQVENVALACCSYQLKHMYKITPLNDDQSGKSEGGCITYPSSEGMKEALNLVYDNLPPHLKACLLYMNMYPEGYTTKKDELVKQWVAEDFIGSVQGQDRENTAGCYFDALVSSGLVQSVDTDHNGDVLSCTLHHMVLDLIRQKSMEENFVTVVNYFQTILGLPDKVRRLSVQLGGAKGANTIPDNMRTSQVRSLLFSGFFKGVPSIVEYGLLQVLILHIWSDQDKTFDLTSIGELYRLRYLKIVCNITVKLPGKIRRLRHLGTLQVDARLAVVPSDIIHLDKLLHLRLRSESILPHGVGHMTSLRTLGYFDLNSNPKINLMDLHKLTNLQNLQLTCSTVPPAKCLEKNMQLLSSVLNKLSILQSVTLVPATGSSNVNTLQADNDTGASGMIISFDGFSSVSPAPAHLRRLELSRRCCIFSRLPKWHGELAQLCVLKIAVKELSNEDTDILKGLPALTVLSLHVMTTSAEMIVFGKGGFSVLIYFKFTCTVPWLKFEENAMPNLQKLRLGFNATAVDKQGIIIEHLSCIKEISAIVGCVNVGAGSACQKAIMNDPRNPKVQWMGSIYVGDEGTGHLVTHEAQEYYRAQGKVSGGGEIMDETDGIQDENNEAANKNNPRNQMVQSMGSIYYGLKGTEMVTIRPRNQPGQLLMTVLGRLLRPIIPTLLASILCYVLGWLLSSIIRSVPLKQRSMATPTSWDVGTAGWVIVLGWLLSPIIAFLLPKTLSCLGFDTSKKLLELENCIIPELQQAMRAVDQERMTQRVEKLKPDVATLDKMAAMLRHSQEEAEDIFDDAKQKIVSGDIVYDAVQTCSDYFYRSSLGITGILRRGSCQLLQWAQSISTLFQWFPRMHAYMFFTICYETAASNFSGRWFCCLCNSFGLFINCCRSMFYSIVHAIELACLYRDWSYDVVGIIGYQENATVLSFFLTAISKQNLKKRIEKVQSTINEVKKSQLLCVVSKNTPDDIANRNRCRIRTASKLKVFGREVLRDNIMAKLRETRHCDAPSSSACPCYSVVGIYGLAGSGKTTFAQYTRDFIEGCEEKLFDTIMCIHLSETFSVDDIFHQMLKDITKDWHSSFSDRGELEEKLKESLSDKRFFLILDDLWVKNKSDLQLQELLSPLNVGKKGSKILVTAQAKDAARALCADEPIKMPDLDEDQYFSMFMHYALGGTSVVDEEFIRVGRLIAEKLHRSPIAAVTVAEKLETNADIHFWKNTANNDMLNDTMYALWWSYQRLDPDIRRCFEFCNIFPRRSKLRRGELVRLWIAQGFVKTSSANMEAVAECYLQELVSYSFLQPEGTSSESSDTDCFTIHGLLYDLLDKVCGSDYYRIENARSQRGESWKGDIPEDVRHLFVENCDGKMIEKILGLKKLRTLIIYIVEWDTPVEEKFINGICKRLLKLRALHVALRHAYDPINAPNKFSVPESISQLKHLRYLAFRINHQCTVLLPGALNKLQHIQQLDFGSCNILGSTSLDLLNLQHIICGAMKFPNIGKLTSLQTIPGFTASNEQGCELKQLRDLNKLHGSLRIVGLENVKSKEEALEANLAAKERLAELKLHWEGDDDTGCSPEVEAEVLEGLCPHVGLKTLHIYSYEGSRCPNWMVGKQNVGLQELLLYGWNQLGPAPEIAVFPCLRILCLCDSSWEALPDDMEHLMLLKELDIIRCENIRSLPTLPRSLEWFYLASCNVEFMSSCKTVGHPNWQKIQHIPVKGVDIPTPTPSEEEADSDGILGLHQKALGLAMQSGC
ncbi:uncharacterized protein [Triticum aestivum]|nr:uncharacterized protein LOC123072642 isoform X4 [Triticum aestivum]